MRAVILDPLFSPALIPEKPKSSLMKSMHCKAHTAYPGGDLGTVLGLDGSAAVATIREAR
jgi:hypothetical protein